MPAHQTGSGPGSRTESTPATSLPGQSPTSPLNVPRSGSRFGMASLLLRPETRRTVISLGLILGTLLVGSWGYATLSSLKPPPEERSIAPKVYHVEALKIERLDLPEIVVGFGTAHADREVVLSAQVAGEIVSINPQLKVGAELKAAGASIAADGQSRTYEGDLLVRIDPDQYQHKVAQLEAKLKGDETEQQLIRQQIANNRRHHDKARVDYDLAKEQYDRIASLRKKNVSSDAEMTSAALDLQRYQESLITLENERDLFPIRQDQLEQRLEMNRAELKLARLDLARTNVRPPFSGRLSEVSVELGQHVRVGDPLMKLVDLNVVEVPVSLPLAESAKIATAVQKNEYPRVLLAENETSPPRWTGLVVRMAPVADELTRTVKAYVQVENGSQTVPLLPGTFVYALIQGPQLQQVIPVPRDSLLNGQVYVAENGKARLRTVRIREQLRALSILESGLEPGEKIIISNLDVLFDGASVSIGTERSASEELQRRRLMISQGLNSKANPQ